MINTFGTIKGFVADNPKIRTTKSGHNAMDFTVACNHYSATSDEPKVSYFDVVCYDEMAETLQDIRKGVRLMVIGEICQDRWTNDSGKECQRIKLVAKDIRRIHDNN